MYIEPKKTVAPVYMPYIVALLYLVTIGSVIHGFFSKSSFIISIICIVILFVLSKIFSWYQYSTIEQGGTYIEYKVTTLVSIFGKDTATYKIYTVDRYKIKKNSLVIYGDIFYTEPFVAMKKIKKVTIQDYNEDVLKLINKGVKK